MDICQSSLKTGLEGGKNQLIGVVGRQNKEGQVQDGDRIRDGSASNSEPLLGPDLLSWSNVSEIVPVIKLVQVQMSP